MLELTGRISEAQELAGQIKGVRGNGIASIQKTGTQGLVDTYTITFTNGNTSTFTVKNGQNGTGAVADVWQNGVSVLDGDTAKVTVPTKVSDLTNDSDFVSGDVIADEYSASSTYAVGDYCIHDGQFYRCTTAISTSEAWTAGHWTAVTVADELTDLKEDFNEITNVNFTENDGYINNNGSISSASETTQEKYTDKIAVSPAEKIKIVLDNTSAVSMWIAYGLYDENGAFIDRTVLLPATSTKHYSGIVTIPSGARYISFTYRTYGTITKTVYSLASINRINSELFRVNNNVSYLDKTDLTLYVKGINALLTNNAFLKITGAAQSNNSYKASDYLKVLSGQIVKYNLKSTTTTAILCFYNSSKEFVSYVAGTDNLASGTFTAPSDGFIRFATANDSIGNAYCYSQTDITPNFVQTVPPEENLNILLLGDSIFGNDGEIAGYLNNMCASCVNGAFGGTRVTSRDTGDWQYFDGISLVQALASQIWTDQDTAAANLAGDYSWITSRLNGLKAVDMDEIDVICIDWGTNDYTAGCTIEEITTAYNTVIDTLQTAFPEIRLLICTPIWRCWGNEQDNDNGDNHVVNVSTLKEIALAIEQFAKDKRISVLNSYQNMPLSYKTRDTYFDAIGSGNTGTRYTHLNTFGNHVYAYLIHGKLRSIY